jgi:hypothetical protein
MVPDIASAGSSFKGALAYYLHDKKREGERERLTSERVAWTETRNLMTRDPEVAGRVMAATAMDADRLKAQAGVRKTGRRSDRSVYAYTLAWHPDEAKTMTRAEMVRAADETLRVLGAEDRQAILVCHTDRPHPHVHIIVNRVSPQDGRMLGTSNDRLKLSQWALAYRQARGQEQYCPKRAENWDIRLSQAKPGELKYHRAKADVPRQTVEDVKAAHALHGPEAERIIAKQRVETAKVAQESAATRARHSAEWKSLAQADKARRAHISTSAENAIQDALFSIKATYRPQWQELGRRHSKERRDYQIRETRVLGKIRNAIDAVTSARQLDPESSRGFVSNAFNYLISAPKRAKAFERKLAAEARALGTAQTTAIRTVTGSIRKERDRLLKAARATAVTERTALSQRQAVDVGLLKAKWRHLSEGRARAFEAARRAAQVKAQASAETREAFTAAAEGRKPRSTGRRRSRRRERD